MAMLHDSIARKAGSAVLSAVLAGAFCVPVPALAATRAAEGDAAGAAAVQEPGDPSATPAYVPGEVLVSFEDGTTTRQAQRTLDSSEAVDGEGLEDVTAEDLDAGFLEVPVAEGISVPEAVEELVDDPRVAHVQPNFIYRLADDGVGDASDDADADDVEVSPVEVNDPLLGDQWHLDAIGARKAWNYATCDNEVTVAVLDTGCDLDHPDLVGNIVASYDSAGDKSSENGTSKHWSADDGDGHGTHVCGIVAARADNELGVAGVSGNANLLPVKVFYYDDGKTKYYDEDGSWYTYDPGWYATSADIAAGYSYLLSDAATDVDGDGTVESVVDEYNVRVVNMSLELEVEEEDGQGGWTQSDATTCDIGSDGEFVEKDYLTEGLITRAREKGIVTVAAAGNGDEDNHVGRETVNIWPSDFAGTVSVIATTDGNARASFSNYGNAKSISAPGDGVYSTKKSGTYGTMSGTSMAAPVVSGVLALMFAANPDLTADEAKQILYDTATDLGDPGFDAQFANGLVNAEAAVKAAIDQKAPSDDSGDTGGDDPAGDGGDDPAGNGGDDSGGAGGDDPAGTGGDGPADTGGDDPAGDGGGGSDGTGVVGDTGNSDDSAADIGASASGKGGGEGVADAYPPVGKVVTKKGMRYQVTRSSASGGSVRVLGPAKSKLKATKLTIPATVTVSKLKYKVTAIGAKAFSRAKRLKTLVVKSKTVSKVGSRALKGAKRLVKVRVPKARRAKYRKLFKKAGLPKKARVTVL